MLELKEEACTVKMIGRKSREWLERIGRGLGMPTKEDRGPLLIQYLGKRGATYPCVRAMVTILTSPYSCREMTVVFRELAHREEDTDVCFVVWDWLSCEITIVPDGFGTHSGTGGWGLGVVLALIQFYQIPLKEKWVEADQFDAITKVVYRYAGSKKVGTRDVGKSP